MTTTQFSERLNEKKFMHRGEDDAPLNTSEYGVSYVTILHELQKTYNWKKSFGVIKKTKKVVVPIDVDAQTGNNSIDENRKNQIKKIRETAPRKTIQSQHIREKREFTHSLNKTQHEPRTIKEKKEKLIKNMN
ncbi:hypothetical protein EHI8A_037060 [Entamoeba histolytica HM-1:IMSS-B]|uniref:Uncharacterized protein n=6 Tax=Entamoeba histolytica TaxID=5759 RepID=C4LY64_ENTH1|nr:hypothetical protein EHI_051450 [Entamoeba histolytica HM-1:IMSS]EMD43344.1 Hypothetical protein EHI5A_053510 [Entamoeba histolytica KU27]EMH75643.1 hypothetical protein EHI8A_037060 [Entamoeba histolytica HM-1:IMSS-B]EMS17747.1 hypothetical protein KM1_075090 [Entamoeba histolytica HM-3:IMSS]ENY60709.1 hypothetical protein EHI7A_038540 [Entamoeba histolytica HM-1:IMSS-A]GAT93731.1 hypothetical protein CL6EHI_051450 [Entamoeba histolytica]|eukprot:XP_651292.1 hypothetical protein EHI_051450 [Entamoeba histolytica HM-1:IMSS]